MTLYNNVTVQPLVKPCVTVSVEKSQKRFNIMHSWERCLQTGKEGLDAVMVCGGYNYGGFSYI